MKKTRTTLAKIEELFKELSYTVRYEKGNFNSGYCIVEERNIVVVNKFFDIEARINVLCDILSQLSIVEEQLSESVLQFLKNLIKSSFYQKEGQEELESV